MKQKTFHPGYTLSYYFNKNHESVDKPGSVVDNHSSRPCLTAGLKQRTRGRVEPTHSPPIWPCSGWGLPCHAALAPHAVGSYPTVSPLPRASCDAVRRFAFCCTGRRLAPPRRYLALCSVEPGLSSARSSRDAVVLADSAGRDCLTDGLTSLLRIRRPRKPSFTDAGAHGAASSCRHVLAVPTRRRTAPCAARR